MKIVTIPCNRANYGGLRQKVEYLVVHYTAGSNDTAENNGAYFAREYTGTSAHYFVDETTVVCSVPEEYAAWHCGADVYRHSDCRNHNSIGVEICTKIENGVYSFSPQALALAAQLLRQLMEKYQIPQDRVLRHYDVTGKTCPAPFVGQGHSAWEAFKGGLKMYQTLQDVPQWAQQTVSKLVAMGVLHGDGENLNLSQDLLRIMVILDRLGVLKKEENNGSNIEQSRSDVSE